jgi:hypothetical protein
MRGKETLNQAQKERGQAHLPDPEEIKTVV